MGSCHETKSGLGCLRYIFRTRCCRVKHPDLWKEYVFCDSPSAWLEVFFLLTRKSQTFSTVSLVYMALLVALNLVLMRVLRFELGAYRITIGHIATIMAGLWLGPVSGGLCGLAADLLGCLLDGYAVNPIISVGAMLWGILPAVTLRKLADKGRKVQSIGITISVCCTCVLSIIGCTTAGLVLLMGYNFYAIIPGRIALAAIMAVIYSLLANLLYFSPVTKMIR